MNGKVLLMLAILVAPVLLQAQAEPAEEPPPDTSGNAMEEVQPSQPAPEAPEPAHIPDTPAPEQCSVFHYASLPPLPPQCALTGTFQTAGGTTIYQLTCCG